MRDARRFPPLCSRFSQDRWGRVLVQLCLSLLFLHVAYLATNLKGVLSPPCCVAMAVIVHVTLIASFCWMLIEGLLLYEILVTVFRKGDTKFVLKRLVFGWGTYRTTPHSRCKRDRITVTFVIGVQSSGLSASGCSLSSKWHTCARKQLLFMTQSWHWPRMP